MDQGIKQQWVDALRSGKFKKGIGVLRDADDNYCVLGVLCEVVGVAWGEDLVRSGTGHKIGYHVVNSNKLIKSFAMLPEDVLDKLELDYEAASELTHHNDFVDPESFERIADYIEQAL